MSFDEEADGARRDEEMIREAEKLYGEEGRVWAEKWAEKKRATRRQAIEEQALKDRIAEKLRRCDKTYCKPGALCSTCNTLRRL